MELKVVLISIFIILFLFSESNAGRLETNGTHIELNDSEYLNITLDSSEPVKLVLESVPEMITMHFESASDATSTQITLSGFNTQTTYHKYEDDYHNHTAFITDANGNYTYTQDISKRHLIFIQPRHSTRFINDNYTGGDCTLIGSWKADTRTCTLTANLTETIQIDSGGIILNGGGHSITGSNTGNGIYLSGRSSVTIKNLDIKSFSYGMYLYLSSNNNLTGNTASKNHEGISLRYSNNNTLSYNTVNSNRDYGIDLYSPGYSPGNIVLNNNIINSNGNRGIGLYYSGDILFDSNIIDSNGNRGIGLFSPEYSPSNIILNNNTVSSNGDEGIDIYFTGNVTLNSNIVSLNGYQGIGLFSPGYSPGNILFNNNIVNSNGGEGIDIYFTGNVTLDSNSVNSNGKEGIGLFSPGYSPGNVTLNSNSVNSNSYEGINLYSTGNATLNSNSINSNGYDGINLYSDNLYPDSIIILNNNAANSNGYNGIVLDSPINSVLSSNTANSNNDNGIVLYDSSNSTLSSNTANSNGNNGIILWYSNGDTLSGNNVLNNRQGIYLSSSNNNLLYHNNLINNAVYNAYDEGTNLWNSGAEGNYYSDFTSTDTNNDGIGDTLYPIPGGSSVDGYPLMAPYSGGAAITLQPLSLKIGVILGKPSDKEQDPIHNKQYFENLLQRMRDYYINNSYGRIVIDLNRSKVFDNNSNWYRVANNSLYYGKNYSIIVSVNGTNQTLWVDRTDEFKDAVIKSVSEPLDTYDVLAIVHQGDGENYRYYDEMRTNAFIYSNTSQNHFIVSEKDLMGTWAHEFGHLIGVFEKPKEYTPDRYVNGDLRAWDLMASGNYLTDDVNNDRSGTSYPSHMSSWTKEYLGWLNYNIVSDKQTYWIPALEQMKYGDKVTVYDVPKDNESKYSYILEVRSENIDIWDKYLYGAKYNYSDMLVIYRVDTTSIGSRSDVVSVFEDGSKEDMVILETGEEYKDSHAEIIIKLAETIGNTPNGYGANIKIMTNQTYNQTGAGLSPNTNTSFIEWLLELLRQIIDLFYAQPIDYKNFVLPDYDLHAYTLDGRHVGVNYTTDDYENQIEGATTSGDIFGGFEWIFVPETEKVVFRVSNHDTGEFLKKYPEASDIISDMGYNLSIYHEDSKSTRYSETMIDQQIEAGKERNYFFDVIKNEDGTYKIIIDDIPPIISSILPNSVTNNTQISAEFADNPDGSGIDSDSISLIIDDADVTQNATITNSRVSIAPVLKDGQHEVFLNVSDKAGNMATVNWNFILDTVPPDVAINYPSNYSFARGLITVSGTATDLHLDTVALEIDGIKVSNTSTYLWDTTNLKDGNLAITLSAIDLVKNSAYISINVTIDNTLPVIQLYLANGTEYYSDQNLIIDYNMTDAISGIASSSAVMDGNTVAKGDLIDLRNLSIGSHIIRVTADDNAGNNAEESTTFIIKPLPAVIEIEPHTLNINSNGRWIKAEIQIPGYNAKLIDVSSIRLNGTIPAEIKSSKDEKDKEGEKEDDSDNEHSKSEYDSELEIKFNRTLVKGIISPGNATLYILGKVSGAAFLGNNTIKVIENHKKNSAEKEENTEGNRENSKNKEKRI